MAYCPQFFSTQFGPVNIVRRMLGLDAINFMGEQSMFRSLYVWSEVWQGSGYGAVIYIAAIAGIDPQLHEAALIDVRIDSSGCGMLMCGHIAHGRYYADNELRFNYVSGAMRRYTSCRIR